MEANAILPALLLLGVWAWVAAGVRRRRGFDWVMAFYMAIRVMLGWLLLAAMLISIIGLLANIGS